MFLRFSESLAIHNHNTDISIITIIKLLPFQGKWRVLGIKDRYFKMVFGRLCSPEVFEVERR